ncbi:redox-sensing transcriptional repressor Rex [Actinomycetospora lemnae]|uniref:redox-sensing transcriptional repressor Rex n=1 Tax=Actinomycetospora lemnae TaxID=3019891 RepID=UPI002FCD5E1C
MTVDRGTRPSRRPVPSTRTPEDALAPVDAQDTTDQTDAATRPVPEATVARLAVYLRVLTTLLDEGRGTVSSEELAAAAGVNSTTLRKDLSHIGSSGVRGVGYDVSRLTAEVEATLGLTRPHAVALVGVGNLGHALAGYGGFAQRGFPVAALFDVDPALVGTTIGGVEVEHADAIGAVCAARGVTIGVVATPAPAAQRVCDHLVAAGVRSILNFAPTVLSVPAGVEVRKVDLAVEMQVLSFHVARRHGTVPAAGPAGELTRPADQTPREAVSR